MDFSEESSRSDHSPVPIRKEPQVPTSVNAFLRQSNELQADIKELGELCKKITPNIADLYSETAREQDWEWLNQVLVQNSLEPVALYTAEENRLVPEPSALFATLVSFLDKHDEAKAKLSKYQQIVKELDTEKTELLRELQQTREGPRKPEHSREEPRSQDKEVFRSFMGRDYSGSSHSDCKVLGLIAHYHSKTQVLDEISSTLSLSSPSEILSSIRKMQEVMSALPRVEDFMDLICSEVLPYTSSSRPEDVAPTIRSWRKKLYFLETQLNKYREALGGKDAALERARAMGHFCRLFEVTRNSAHPAVEQVYYFVFEMKSFLAVCFMQFARKCYELPKNCSVKKVLRELVKSIEN